MKMRKLGNSLGNHSNEGKYEKESNLGIPHQINFACKVLNKTEMWRHIILKLAYIKCNENLFCRFRVVICIQTER
jgi:hypothetical protein